MASHRMSQSIRQQQTQKLGAHQLLLTKLTAMAKLELVEHLDRELAENPLLEEGAAGEPDSGFDVATDLPEKPPKPSDENGLDDADLAASFGDHDGSGYQPRQAREIGEALPLESLAATGEGLAEYLHRQLNLRPSSAQTREICTVIIGNIGETGYLEARLDELAEFGEWSVADVEQGLAHVQSFDPAGVAARDLRECLLLQIRRMELNRVCETLVSDHLDLVASHRLREAAAATGVALADVRSALEVIGRLDPSPGTKYLQQKPVYVTPDVAIVKTDDAGYAAQARDEGIPRLRVSATYLRLLKQPDSSPETRAYVRERLGKAQGLLKAIEMRERTIVKVATCIANLQRDFLDHGVDYLRPLILRDVANQIGMHESTVHRAISHKYVDTPRGVFPLKYFFHSAVGSADGTKVSSVAIRERIRQLIAAEEEARPLSDQGLVDALKRQGILLSRRAAANYREDLRIPSSTERRHRHQWGSDSHA